MVSTGTEEGKAPMAKNGTRLVILFTNHLRQSQGEYPLNQLFPSVDSFDNRYAWVFEWDQDKEKIVTVRAYLDSALINSVMQ